MTGWFPFFFNFVGIFSLSGLRALTFFDLTRMHYDLGIRQDTQDGDEGYAVVLYALKLGNSGGG